MLHSINLLPWREAQKQAHKRRFVHFLLVGGVFSLALQGAAGWYLDQQAQLQQQRNEFLSQHIVVLDRQILSLQQAEQQYQDLVSRLATVESLQRKRNKTTQFMDLIPELIPEGVYVDKMSMNGHRIEINGISDSTARLASMLDLLENAALISDVEMHSIVSGSYRFNKQFQSFKVLFLFDEPATTDEKEVANG